MHKHGAHKKLSAMVATSGAGTADPSGAQEFTPVFSGVRATRSLVFMCMFCRSLFVLLYIFFWPLCCLFFFDIRILIDPLVSSNTSYIINTEVH